MGRRWSVGLHLRGHWPWPLIFKACSRSELLFHHEISSSIKMKWDDPEMNTVCIYHADPISWWFDCIFIICTYGVSGIHYFVTNWVMDRLFLYVGLYGTCHNPVIGVEFNRERRLIMFMMTWAELVCSRFSESICPFIHELYNIGLCVGTKSGIFVLKSNCCICLIHIHYIGLILYIGIKGGLEIQYVEYIFIGTSSIVVPSVFKSIQSTIQHSRKADKYKGETDSQRGRVCVGKYTNSIVHFLSLYS